jgi:hypothetical protein
MQTGICLTPLVLEENLLIGGQATRQSAGLGGTAEDMDSVTGITPQNNGVELRVVLPVTPMAPTAPVERSITAAAEQHPIDVFPDQYIPPHRPRHVVGSAPAKQSPSTKQQHLSEELPAQYVSSKQPRPATKASADLSQSHPFNSALSEDSMNCDLIPCLGDDISFFQQELEVNTKGLEEAQSAEGEDKWHWCEVDLEFCGLIW